MRIVLRHLTGLGLAESLVVILQVLGLRKPQRIGGQHRHKLWQIHVPPYRRIVTDFIIHLPAPDEDSTIRPPPYRRLYLPPPLLGSPWEGCIHAASRSRDRQGAGRRGLSKAPSNRGRPGISRSQGR